MLVAGVGLITKQVGSLSLEMAELITLFGVSYSCWSGTSGSGCICLLVAVYFGAHAKKPPHCSRTPYGQLPVRVGGYHRGGGPQFEARHRPLHSERTFSQAPSIRRVWCLQTQIP